MLSAVAAHSGRGGRLVSHQLWTQVLVLFSDLFYLLSLNGLSHSSSFRRFSCSDK